MVYADKESECLLYSSEWNEEDDGKTEDDDDERGQFNSKQDAKRNKCELSSAYSPLIKGLGLPLSPSPTAPALNHRPPPTNTKTYQALHTKCITSAYHIICREYPRGSYLLPIRQPDRVQPSRDKNAPAHCKLHLTARWRRATNVPERRKSPGSRCK